MADVSGCGTDSSPWIFTQPPQIDNRNPLAGATHRSLHWTLRSFARSRFYGLRRLQSCCHRLRLLLSQTLDRSTHSSASFAFRWAGPLRLHLTHSVIYPVLLDVQP